MIGAICLVFLIINLSGKDGWSIPAWRHNVKFMLTVDITLTYLVFAVLLTPLMSLRFLTTPTNFFQHDLTSILALLDFMLCDRPYVSRAKHVWLSLIMPLGYAVYFFSTYALTGIMPVAYFPLDYKKTGMVYDWQQWTGGRDMDHPAMCPSLIDRFSNFEVEKDLSKETANHQSCNHHHVGRFADIPDPQNDFRVKKRN